MEVSFIKFSPTQNVTVLVTDPISREMQPELAASLLAYDSIGGEQVGFLEEPTLPGAKARLQMMGGEFCGNASMSLGVYLARQDGLAAEESADYRLEVSGADTLVGCRIERTEQGYRGTVQMPLPQRTGTVHLETDSGEKELSIVELPGISHVIAPAETGLGKDEIERRIRKWNETVRTDALGVLRWDERTQTMEPIVYVPSTDSAVWERGCGSGTAALGCWKAVRAGRSYSGSVRQPGGEIVVSVRTEGTVITGLTITGNVAVTAEGKAFL